MKIYRSGNCIRNNTKNANTPNKTSQINNKVFDTYLKSDKQHDVVGQKSNHGG